MGSTQFQNLAQEAEQAELLTKREIQLLGWMVEGYSNKAIAKELFISENKCKSDKSELY